MQILLKKKQQKSRNYEIGNKNDIDDNGYLLLIVLRVPNVIVLKFKVQFNLIHPYQSQLLKICNRI